MKKGFLYIMIVLLMGETTGLTQLVKMPELYQHYREHVSLNPSINFWDYLSMHYWGQDLDDNDYEKDMQLPFKKHDAHAPSFLFVTNHREFVLQPQAWPMERDRPMERSSCYFNPAGKSLFRPPKI